MKCVNCPNNAEFTLADKGANPISYCPLCLPPHLQVRALSGQLSLNGAAKPGNATVVEEPKKTTKKAASKPTTTEVDVESTEEPTEEEV
jgi:hypothetical protein